MKTKNPFKQFRKVDIISAVEWYELCVTGLRRVNGAYTIASNIEFKTGEEINNEGLSNNNPLSEEYSDKWFVVYNLKLGNDFEKRSEITEDCFIPFSELEKSLIASQNQYLKEKKARAKKKQRLSKKAKKSLIVKTRGKK